MIDQSHQPLQTLSRQALIERLTELRQLQAIALAHDDRERAADLGHVAKPYQAELDGRDDDPLIRELRLLT